MTDVDNNNNNKTWKRKPNPLGPSFDAKCKKCGITVPAETAINETATRFNCAFHMLVHNIQVQMEDVEAWFDFMPPKEDQRPFKDGVIPE
jgi:hypothetical protein